MGKVSRQQNSKIGKITNPHKLWSFFKLGNKQHAYILSLCIQNGWSFPHKRTTHEVADLKKLDTWLRGAKSPVKKPLLDMTQEETSKIIFALEQMLEKANA